MASIPPSPHQQSAQGSRNLSEKISPSILLAVAILATIFFTCVLIHLIVKYFLKSFHREAEEIGSATAFQGQLQQLFHLHDSGVDQSFIDTLPVFLYKAIIGLDDPFDCVVCLCEFEADDKLRLLPKCSHAFHIECIDAWLLSHSTCPLCRRSLLPDLSPSHSPMVLLLESASVSSARDVPSLRGDSEVLEEEENFHKEGEIGVEEDLDLPSSEAVEAKVFPVKLGKFRNAESDDGGEGTGCGNGDLNEMRCFSMGAFEYVMNERSALQVAIMPLKGRCQSMREVVTRSSGFIRESGHESARISYECYKKESFSISKIWMRSRKERAAHEDCSRRALSFRLPTKHNILGRRAAADQFDVAGSVKAGSTEVGSDLEDGGFSHKVCSRADEAPSFARRTMLWIARRQKSKVVNHG